MKVLIKIDNNKLSFCNRKKLNNEFKNMLNTNVISNDQLVFSDEYIIQNNKLVYNFINELIKTYDINSISFQTNAVAELIMPFINKFKAIQNIYFESDEILPYNFCEKICKMANIQTVSAQYIPQYLFEMFDKYGILPESRNEILFTSNFMETNGLNTYSSIYYKTSVYLYFPAEQNDIEDFTSFCKINNNLKTVIINIPSKFNLEELILIIKENCKKRVKIIIHGDLQNDEVITFLKKYKKSILKKYNISIKLKYSKKFIQDNIIKETNNTILRSCALIMVSIAFLSIGCIIFDRYNSIAKDKKFTTEIKEYIKDNTIKNKDIQIANKNETTIITENNDYIKTLKEINNEAVGWIKVNNTKIDYSVMQHDDNNYYLNHNIYKNYDSNGWIFMDYQNHKDVLDDNTILYGHNRYINGIMFGTLNKTLNKSWYENKENLIIKFDTLYGSYKFKIFSIYTIKTTSDYLTTSFDNAKDKLNFLNMIKSRSINNFNVDLNEQSKILTLSTCNNEVSRLVVHAVLLENN